MNTDYAKTIRKLEHCHRLEGGHGGGIGGEVGVTGILWVNVILGVTAIVCVNHFGVYNPSFTTKTING
jgi:hypothetical protein